MLFRVIFKIVVVCCYLYQVHLSDNFVSIVFTVFVILLFYVSTSGNQPLYVDPTGEQLLPAIQFIHGHRIQSVWVELLYPLTVIISEITTGHGRGVLYLLVTWLPLRGCAPYMG